MQTIYDMLHKDHEKVSAALDELVAAKDVSADRRAELFSEIKSDLETHTKFEEDVFYPTFRSAKDDSEAKQEVKQAVDEHEDAKARLRRLDGLDKDSDEFLSEISALRTALEHHIAEEENQIFPQARETLSAGEATELGQRYEQMKRG